MYKHKADELSKKAWDCELARSIPALSDHGGNREQFDKNKNINLVNPSIKGGTSKEYRISKLKRDHPKIVERLMQI